MLLQTQPGASAATGPSLMLIEGSLTALAIALAFAWPRLANRWFTRIEHTFVKLARKQGLAVVSVGLAALLLRLAILPFCPIPLPFVQDDFSFLLAANTFASGHLTNPTPPMWMHFESIQISMTPTYMSMYFPTHGLILAAGKVLFGHPWFGLLIVTSLMCAALCWMLQAWLPPTWALLGGLIAVMRLGLFSYWINTYSGGGSVAALGGALVLGAFPRFLRTKSLRHALLLALGIILLATSRPFEGILLCLPVAAVLIYKLFFANNHPKRLLVLCRTALPIALILVAALWMGYYNQQVFGNPLTPPYNLNRATYAVVPYWLWQAPRPEPIYRHKSIRDFYIGEELGYSNKLHTTAGFLSETLLLKPLRATLFFAGIALLPPVIMLRRVLLDRRTRFLVLCTALVVGGVLLETWLIPHYLAAITAAIYALGLQAMRHLHQWKTNSRPLGKAILRFTITICIALCILRLWAEPLRIQLARWPSGAWASSWHGPPRMGAERAMIQSQLEKLPGNQLILVRYSASHSSLDEWVYNAPDIDSAKVIWAHEMDQANNRELIRYYSDRKLWLVEPDTATLIPYAPQQRAAQ